MTFNRQTYDVRPVYKDDLAMNYEQETNQRFFRAKLSGKIDFVRHDADMIINAPFETEFLLTILSSVDLGQTWSTYYTCSFYKTDCTINEDDRKVSVQPSVKDAYVDVLAGLEKEFNLIELAPVIQPIKMTKRPMFQIYTTGENIVSCLCGGNAFEQDAVNADGDKARACHFAAFEEYWEFNFVNPISGFVMPFKGQMLGDGSEFHNSTEAFWLEYFEGYTIDQNPPAGETWYYCTNGIRIYGIDAPTTVRWEFSQTQHTQTYIIYEDIPNELTFTPELSGDPELEALRTAYGIYGRMVTDLDTITISGTPTDTYEIPSDDLVVDNRNYRYCIGFRNFNLQQSSRTSLTPTKWGVNDNGEYFLPPDDSHAWYPIGRSQWVNTSIWVEYDSTLESWETAGRKQYTLKDSYPIWSVIKVLLAQVAPTVSHNGTTDYSVFLYDTQTGTGVRPVADMTKLFITPKSNIIVGEYQEPASKAPVTLADVFNMLRNVYGLYWFIDGQNRLRIEHLRWFKNGGTYLTGQEVIGYDLTTLENVRNGKKWAFGTTEYQFEKEQMPERYQYEWMDEGTLLFNGNPIDIVSRFVQLGKVEEVTVSNFTSDIDYMLLAPEMCSKDGFAVLGAEQVSGEYVLPFLRTEIGVYAYELQNFALSMWFLQQYYLTYDMPAWSIKVNDEDATALGIQRNKKQQVAFPAGNSDPDTFHLVKTYIGNGEFDKLAINISSRMAKVTLKYDTYEYVTEQ